MMMMVVGGWEGWGGWVVCMELWPLAMQNATDMATLCCWARVRLFWHPGQATTWHPGVCQVATGNSTWLCPVVVHQPMKQLARPPMPSCHQGTTHTGCAGLPSLFWPHLGWATMPGCHQGTTQIGCAGLPSLFFATGCLSRPLRVPLHSLD